ncbi:hypothetical protein NEMBOFW57_003502 [Staphylotrichum longicolle]|uniref:Uncharacterized protein n=1 Tax=Staphylotrichum longicolle TaxID=669026 RepID=A0AAD4F5K5_9PEZI|nr:hypothetical protein NEMBOFW57_003502 [Staphylotrichum longicolle]
MLALTFFASAALLAQGALSEGIHLLNCYSMTGTPWPHTAISLVAYCANDADCSKTSYFLPSSDVCIMSNTTDATFHQWADGTDQSCTFPSSGVTFSWNIPTTIGWDPVYSPAGTGSNGYRSFDGFKDDGTQGAVFDFHSCSKRYYYI